MMLHPSEEFKFPLFEGKTFLSPEEYAQVEVLFEQLFPADHQQGIPGATDAKAAQFVSRLLALDESEYYKIPIWRKIYREYLPLLNTVSQKLFNKPLLDVTPNEVVELLTLLQKNLLTGLPGNINQKEFFNVLHEHCIKGCFADPRWGGNHGNIMWRWLGWIQPAEDITF